MVVGNGIFKLAQFLERIAKIVMGLYIFGLNGGGPQITLNCLVEKPLPA